MLVFLLLKKVLSASSYGHFTATKEFRSQCYIFRFCKDNIVQCVSDQYFKPYIVQNVIDQYFKPYIVQSVIDQYFKPYTVQNVSDQYFNPYIVQNVIPGTRNREAWGPEPKLQRPLNARPGAKVPQIYPLRARRRPRRVNRVRLVFCMWLFVCVFLHVSFFMCLSSEAFVSCVGLLFL